jgi:hypothetical protein
MMEAQPIGRNWRQRHERGDRGVGPRIAVTHCLPCSPSTTAIAAMR